MDLPLPKDASSYQKAVQNLGNEFVPLSQLANAKCGSDWALPELLAFRVLVKDEGSKKVPTYLKDFYTKADNKPDQSEDFLRVSKILHTGRWRESPGETLLGFRTVFNRFLKVLAEVVREPKSVMEPRRSLRTAGETRSYASVNSSQSTDGAGKEEEEGADEEEEEGPVEEDDKETQTESESSGYQSSSGSDPDYDDITTARSQEKSETVTRELIHVLLDHLTCCASLPKHRPFRLEWTSAESRFMFSVPLKPTKAKAAYSPGNKPHKVFAQEASQIIGMIHEREALAEASIRRKENHRVIPLISISQEHVWMIFAKYTDDYYNFLQSGDISKEEYLVLEQYGPYNLTTESQFKRLSTVIVALHMFLADLGQLPSGVE